MVDEMNGIYCGLKEMRSNMNNEMWTEGNEIKHEKILCFILIIAFSLFGFWVIERVNCSCSHFFIKVTVYKIFFFFPDWRFYFDLKCTHSQDFQHKKSVNFCTVEQKATIFLPHWSNFEIKLQVPTKKVIFQLLL